MPRQRPAGPLPGGGKYARDNRRLRTARWSRARPQLVADMLLSESMVIATLSMRLPPRQEADTIRTLCAFWNSTRALPGCLGGGVYEEVGLDRAALDLEIWNQAHDLEAHIRSAGYELLIAVMETAPGPPALSFQFVTETRGLQGCESLLLTRHPLPPPTVTHP